MTIKNTTPPAPPRSERSERSGGAGGVVAKKSPSPSTTLPDPHAKPRKRTFTEAYRLRVLTEIDNAPSGQIGVVLRREGLYSPMISRWRRWRDAAAKRVVKVSVKESVKYWRGEAARAQAQVVHLELRLQKTEALVDIQKKLTSVFDLMSKAERSPQ